MIQQLLLIIAFSLIVYFRSLKFTVITDDIRWYSVNKEDMTSLKAYNWNILSFLANRLYGGCTFLNIKWSFNKNVEIDHLFTMVLHTTICALIYIATGSFLGSLLYACNPINHQTSMWLNGRRYAVNIILVLLSLIAYQHHLWYLSLPLWGMTPLFHMTGLFAPVLWGNLWFMLLPLPFLWFNRHKVMSKVVHRMESIHSKELLIFFPRRLIVVVKSYGFYFFQCIFPSKVLLHYPDLQFWGLTKGGNDDAYSYNVSFFKGIAAILLSVAACFMCQGNDRWFAFFAIASLLQWCNIVYAVSTLADRYANMSNPFIMVLLAKAIETYLDPHSVLLVSGLFIGYYLMSLAITMRMYPVIWDQYKYEIWRSPETVSGRIFYSNFYIKKEEYASAWAIVEEGLKYNPNDFLLLYQAAQCWKGIGNKKECVKFLMRAKENYYEGQEKIQEKVITDFVL